MGMRVSVCPHCAEMATTLVACGEVFGAKSSHYAMALIRTMRAEGRSLEEVIDFLGLIEDAEELAPDVEPTSAPPPYRVVDVAAVPHVEHNA